VQYPNATFDFFSEKSKTRRNQSMVTNHIAKKDVDALKELREQYVRSGEELENADSAAFYTDKALFQREAIKFDSSVISLISELWAVIDVDRSNSLDKQEYKVLMRKVSHILHSTINERRFEEHFEKDWITDSKNFSSIDRNRFVHCFFQLIDQWTDGISKSEYAQFLEDIISCLVIDDGDGSKRIRHDFELIKYDIILAQRRKQEENARLLQLEAQRRLESRRNAKFMNLEFNAQHEAAVQRQSALRAKAKVMRLAKDLAKKPIYAAFEFATDKRIEARRRKDEGKDVAPTNNDIKGWEAENKITVSFPETMENDSGSNAQNLKESYMDGKHEASLHRRQTSSSYSSVVYRSQAPQSNTSPSQTRFSVVYIESPMQENKPHVHSWQRTLPAKGSEDGILTDPSERDKVSVPVVEASVASVSSEHKLTATNMVNPLIIGSNTTHHQLNGKTNDLDFVWTEPRVEHRNNDNLVGIGIRSRASGLEKSPKRSPQKVISAPKVVEDPRIIVLKSPPNGRPTTCPNQNDGNDKLASTIDLESNTSIGKVNDNPISPSLRAGRILSAAARRAPGVAGFQLPSRPESQSPKRVTSKQKFLQSKTNLSSWNELNGWNHEDLPKLEKTSPQVFKGSKIKKGSSSNSFQRHWKSNYASKAKTLALEERSNYLATQTHVNSSMLPELGIQEELVESKVSHQYPFDTIGFNSVRTESVRTCSFYPGCSILHLDQEDAATNETFVGKSLFLATPEPPKIRHQRSKVEIMNRFELSDVSYSYVCNNNSQTISTSECAARLATKTKMKLEGEVETRPATAPPTFSVNCKEPRNANLYSTTTVF
jgi:hypothetical protein